MNGKKLKQHHLANEFGVTPAAVSRWYNGSIPSPDILPKLAQFLGVSVDYLLEKQPPVVSNVSHPNRHAHADLTDPNTTALAYLPPIKNFKISKLREDATAVKTALEQLTKAVSGLEKRIGELEGD